MPVTLLVVSLVVLVLAALVGVALHHRRPAARMAADGTQEITVLVRERYRPSSFRVAAGVPLRIRFDRDESDPCSQQVFMPDFGIERWLAEFRTTTIEVPPAEPGDYLFTCRFGHYIGHIEARPRRLAVRRWLTASRD